MRNPHVVDDADDGSRLLAAGDEVQRLCCSSRTAENTSAAGIAFRPIPTVSRGEESNKAGVEHRIRLRATADESTLIP